MLELCNLKVKLFLYLLKLKSRNIQLTNSILIQGLPEVKGEDTNFLVIETVKGKMGLDISSADIDKTHRLGALPKQWGKVRTVTVKFVWYNDRRKIYTNKKLLKGTKVSIADSLTVQSVAKQVKKNLISRMSGLMTVEWYLKINNGNEETKIYFDWHCGVILRRKKLK